LSKKRTEEQKIKGTIELVEWVDSSESPGWNSLDDVLDFDDPLQCMTMGWVVRETAVLVVLAATQSFSGGVNGVMMIPKCCISKRTRLNVGKPL
jgi:hypothetical protein